MANRMGVTVRFNIDEQRELQKMSQHFRLDAKGIMKLAFNLLVQSAQAVNQKPKEVVNEKPTVEATSADASVSASTTEAVSSGTASKR